MSSVERPQNTDRYNIVEIIARVSVGQIKREDLDENNQAVLSYYLGLMDDDPKFMAQVNARKNQIILDSKNGRRIPLFTPEELREAKHHRKRKKSERQTVFQSEMWPSVSLKTETVLDPERGIVKLHDEMQSRYTWDHNSLIKKEVQVKKVELRNLIGLPVQMGKDSYVKDSFYKFLVREIVTSDTFGIFNEFDRVTINTPPVLDRKILAVTELIGELLYGDLKLWQKRKTFARFVWEYKNKREEDWEQGV